jgi:hypothetical protein
MWDKTVNWAKENYALFIGLSIVVFLSATTFFMDMVTVSQYAARIAGGNLDIYSNYQIGSVLLGKPIMPPLVFIVDGFFYAIPKYLQLINFNYTYDFALLSSLKLIALRSRLIIVFVLSYPLVKYLAQKITKDKKKSLIIAALWITNPILLYFTFTQGNNDIYPAILSFVFLSAVSGGSNIIAMILLGIMAALKNYALFLFVPVAIILARKNFWKIIQYLLVGMAAYLAPNIFYLNNVLHFTKSGGEALFMLNTVIISDINFLVIPVIYFAIVLYLYFSDNEKSLSEDPVDNIARYSVLILSLFFAFAFFLPPWFLWVTPFAIFVIYKNRKLFFLYTALLASLFIVLVVRWGGNIGPAVFRPIFPHILAPEYLIPSLADKNIVAMVYSLLTAFFIVFLYLVFKFKSTKSDLPKNYLLWTLSPIIGFFVVSIGIIVLSNQKYQSLSTERNSVINSLNNASNKNILRTITPQNITDNTQLKNINVSNNSLISTSGDPGVITSVKPEEANGDIFLVIEYKDSGLWRNPHVYWENSEPVFSELKSSSHFYQLDRNRTYIKLDSGKFSKEGVTYLRIDPDNQMGDLSVKKIDILKSPR